MYGFNRALSAAFALAAAGCFTVRETPFPDVRRPAPGVAATNSVSVAVRGFDAEVLEYIWVYGYDTVYVPGHCGRRRAYPGHYHTVGTTTGVPRMRKTDAFNDAVRSRLEEDGFAVMAAQPDYIVEGRFTGPFHDDGDGFMQAMCQLFSAFTCDTSSSEWRGKLKIYDNRTGRLAFHRDYAQRHEATVFSPIPLFGIASYERTTSGYEQNWCLSALSALMAADASDFLKSAGAAGDPR